MRTPHVALSAKAAICSTSGGNHHTPAPSTTHNRLPSAKQCSSRENAAGNAYGSHLQSKGPIVHGEASEELHKNKENPKNLMESCKDKAFVASLTAREIQCYWKEKLPYSVAFLVLA